MEYLGKNLTKIELESLALKIDPGLRSEESNLMDTRWFDYHGLHPVEATYLFAHHYAEQFRIYMETYVDIRTAAQRKAFMPEDIFMAREMTAMWRARGLADRMCMPYDFLLRFAGLRGYKQLHRGFPRPNQLYSEEFVIDLLAEWRAARLVSLRYSRAPGMRASEHKGAPDQLRHVAYVCAQIKTRPAPHRNLLRRMFNEDVLTPKLVADHFPVEEIQRAVE